MKTRRPGPPGAARGDKRRLRRPESQSPGAGFLYGRNAVAEALRGRRRLRALLLAEGIKEDDRIRAIMHAASRAAITITRLPRADLDALLGPVHHQGVALDAGPYPYAPIDDILNAAGTIFALDHLQDPQNLGSLLRTAEAAGVAGVLIPVDRAASVTPAVVNASAGAAEHLRVSIVTNLARALDQVHEAGWWIAGLAAGEDAADLYQTDLPSPIALVIGSEGAGISPNVRKRCDLILSIPMAGKVASLNAASAGAIALYEIVRRQRGESH